MDLLVSTRRAPRHVVVEVRGELDMDTTPQLRAELQRLVDAGDREVVVDLGGVPFMDSSALGDIVLTFTALRDVGGRLSLAAVQRQVATVLKITSLDSVIDIYDTAEAAEADVPPAESARG
ncbi:STAS domain-containing protein [Asanoa sp. WMMD1127]|uniref:STAS domain-containing protein n=1 Tax=Asanoa sp. WMMD1127 TaxID=3016107 RepID=UPI0024169070|nr:STAS domain-containing protein [Asanoa sp. WMMD1127]MDG4820571.1 STAS domain-containing protein [Asanoa sp. WMMD1127]